MKDLETMRVEALPKNMCVLKIDITAIAWKVLTWAYAINVHMKKIPFQIFHFPTSVKFQDFSNCLHRGIQSRNILLSIPFCIYPGFLIKLQNFMNFPSL